MGWMIRRHVLKPFVELVEFIARERPIRVLSGKPEFHVPHLLECHDLAESRRIQRFGRFLIAGRQRKDKDKDPANETYSSQHNATDDSCRIRDFSKFLRFE